MATTEQRVDIHTAPTLGEIGQKMAEAVIDVEKSGYRILCVSHAVDPDGGEQRFSVLMFTERTI
jgi:hypothetical protein